jgi:hypothetical protein
MGAELDRAIILAGKEIPETNLPGTDPHWRGCVWRTGRRALAQLCEILFFVEHSALAATVLIE